MSIHLNRRAMLAGAAAATSSLAPTLAFAQRAQQPSVITNPPRQWGPGAPPASYPDPDVIVIDPSFNNLRLGLSSIQRVGTGFQWAEGPAWSAQGNFVVFSDVQSSIQYRYIWESGQVTAYRRESMHSNGNAFDFQGRQLSAQHGTRRVVRWEHDGSMTVLADSYNGQPLNSPNDFAIHQDGSVWFSDPPYGAQLSEGHPDPGDAPFNPGGLRDPRPGNPPMGIIGATRQVLPHSIYRVDPSGKIDRVASGMTPNGLTFSPDYKRLYFLWGANIAVADVQGTTLSNIRTFTDLMVDGVKCGGDGMRCDRAGNLWAASNAEYGYSGVTVWNPAGRLIGRIRLPEVCANVTFAGPKRDWLFMCGSQSIYLLHLNIQGSAPY